MKTLVIILSLTIGSQAFGQKKEVEFGKVSTQEVEMASYEKDKNAKAVVLYDKGKSIFFDTSDGYDIRFTRHRRIKIFDKGESRLAEISIPYYSDGHGKTEVAKSIEAITYNSKNGMITQKNLDPATIYEERINERWYNKKFVFPDVQDGSILEYRYVLETPFQFNLPDWTFQDKVPTIYSEYEVSMIPFYEYVFLVQGISRFDYQNSVIDKEKRSWGSVVKVNGQNVGPGIEFQDYVHTYVLKDIPAFKDESYISSINDYIIKMDFQLAKFYSPRGGSSNIISTWQTLNEALLKHNDFGKYLKSSSRSAKKILEQEPELISGKINKAQKIIEYVKNNFEWNGYNSKYTSQSVQDFLNNKKGNSADINLFLIALLNEADIKAQPLILSTRDHGKIPTDYPFDHFTNYVIALINTDSIFLADATEELLPSNMLPTRCFNERGLVVNQEDKPNWITLRNNIQSIERKVISLTIDKLTLNVNTKVSIQSTEYESFSNRKRFKNDTLKIKEYYSDKIGSVSKIETFGYENIHLPYFINFEGDFETEKVANNIVLKPFLNLPLSTNSLTQEKRNYPVDFIYPWEEQFEATLVVPDGFTISALPNPYKLNNDLAEINLNYEITDNILTAKGNYKLNKAIYFSGEYSRIKHYFDQIVKFFNQPVVLEIND